MDSCLERAGRSKGRLALENGMVLEGYSFGHEEPRSGELVFQTGMVGYPESLTDPSYCDQILVLTYPLIGNYGVPSDEKDEWGLFKHFESHKIHVAGLIVADYTDKASHWNCTRTLSAWLKHHKIPALFGIDTRMLVKVIRDSGVLLAGINFAPTLPKQLTFDDPNKINLVAKCSTDKPYSIESTVAFAGGKRPTILVIDCGLKYNQLRSFLERGANVRVVPWDYDFLTLEKPGTYQGVFISNGPGDPSFAAKTVENIKKLLALPEQIPVFGICLGNQLLGLAAGGTTYKMKYGNRGHNQPCVDQRTLRCHLTMQNHGYALSTESLPSDWEAMFLNANDKTNEGIRHKTKPFFGVQFHPEAKGGPTDTFYLFDKFLAMVNKTHDSFKHKFDSAVGYVPPTVKKVLILGSGALTIGQAGEFDYSGSLAIKALKEEGITTILLNPNIATVQTSTGLADRIYFDPVTPEYVIKIFEQEKPDGILCTFGGQTALNCGIQLFKMDAFKKYGVQVLGTPIETTIATEDRELFARKMDEINEKTAKSISADTVEQALEAAQAIGYPVILRAAYALGGLGSGFGNNPDELRKLAENALSYSPQVLIERSMKGWKELEYEVVRDSRDNCITVTNMENFDPLGIHTGESIVVAPSQTLTDKEYHMLRNVSIRVIRHLGVIGECNIQFALNPESEEYRIIEVNARLSRSSALASKATGYPLAFVAAKLALGYRLDELKNSVTQVTTACFEPSLDYVVVKMPVWDLKKFNKVVTKIGSSMKSIGEVMSIGRNFEETMQKAIRMVNNAVDGFQPDIAEDSEEELSNPSDKRIFVLASAFKNGMTVDKAHDLTKIDKWFLHKLKNISDLEKYLAQLPNIEALSKELLLECKRLGFSDRQIARCMSLSEMSIRERRVGEFQLVPFVKQIDTVAAEVAAVNNYLYMTYNAMEDDVEFTDHGTMVIGSGGYRIGSSVEFDWCAVSAIKQLRKMNVRSIMVNYNPETVSTDYDVCDRLYFEELSEERVLDIYERESAQGVIVSVGGQIPQNLALKLYRRKVNVLGTHPEMIDAAENRYKFSRLCDEIGVDQPKWRELSSMEDIKSFCEQVGYPCLVRPSYVLSGAAMHVVHSQRDLDMYLKEAVAISKEHPVVISQFIEGAREIECDAVAKEGQLVMHCISEHIENAGVHSGDASLVFPCKTIPQNILKLVHQAAAKIAKELEVSGPFNVQFLARDGWIKVIECNLRASRSFPFVSKTLRDVNLIEMATNIIMGAEVTPYPVSVKDIDYVGVKLAQFSFGRLQGADPVLGVEMASTGELATFGANRFEAFLKGYIARGIKLPFLNPDFKETHGTPTAFISIGLYKEKVEFVPYAQKLLKLGFKLYASSGTADFLTAHDIAATPLDWPGESDLSSGVKNDMQEMMRSGAIHMCFICPSKNYRRSPHFASRGYNIRRTALDNNIPLITNTKFGMMLIDSIEQYPQGTRQMPLAYYDMQESAKMTQVNGSFVNVLPYPLFTSNKKGVTAIDHQRYEHYQDAALLSGFGVNAFLINASLFDASSSTATDNAAMIQRNLNMLTSHTKSDYVLIYEPSANVSLPKSLISSLAGLYINASSGASDFASLNAKFTQCVDLLTSVVLKPLPIFVNASGAALAVLMLLASLSPLQPHLHVTNVQSDSDLLLIAQAKKQKKAHNISCDVNGLELLNASSSFADCVLNNLDVIDCFSVDAGEGNTKTYKDRFSAALSSVLSLCKSNKLSDEEFQSKLIWNPLFALKLSSETHKEQSRLEYSVDFDRQLEDAVSSVGEELKHVSGGIRRVTIRQQNLVVDENLYVQSGHGVHQVPTLATVPAVTEESSATESVSVVPARAQSESTATKEETVAASSLVLPLVEKPLAFKNNLLSSQFEHNVLSVSQFSLSDLTRVFQLTSDMKILERKNQGVSFLRGRVLVSVFYEPSVRTTGSFAAAMQRLGGSVIDIAPPLNSSETFHDFIKTVENYGDAILLRHPQKGAAKQAARFSRKPVINAGDGTGEHPTQALLDVFTIREELGHVSNNVVTVVGDLKNARSVHSLVHLLSLHRGIVLQYVSHPELSMPAEVMEVVRQRGVPQHEFHSLDDKALANTDVLYLTNPKATQCGAELYEKTKRQFRVDSKVMKKLSSRAIVLHPLPRTEDELDSEVDNDPRAAYFRQAANGVYVRMALLSIMLGVA